MMSLLNGEEARENLIGYIKFCSDRLMRCLAFLAEHSVYSTEDKIALETQRIAIVDILYPDEDYHFYAQFAVDAYESIAKMQAENGNKKKTLDALENLCRFAIHFVQYSDDAVNTSPAVRGYCDGGWIHDSEEGWCAHRLKMIREEKLFDFVRDDERYCAVVAEMEKYEK